MKKCDLIHKPNKTHKKVKSIIHMDLIFCCIEYWNLVSKEVKYTYGGTRKSK